MRPRVGSSTAADRRLFAWVVAACATLLLIMAWPMLLGRVWVADDLGEYHLPLRQFYSQQLAAGEPFDWLPSLFSGYYLTGEGQAGTYHPLHLLLYRVLPLGLAFDLELWLSYPVMLVGGYLLLRRWRLARDAALLGSAAFTFSGFNLLHFIHPNGVSLVAHWPWMLWALDWALVDRSNGAEGAKASPAWAWALISLNLGSQLLVGYPQYVWLGMLIALPYAAVCLKDSAAPRTGRVVALILSATIGVLIGAVQLVPTIDALADSNRQTVDEAFSTSGSLHPLNLLQLIEPYLFATRVVGQNTHELGLYLGAVPLILAIWLVSHRPLWGNCRPLIVGALWTIVIALVLAFGEYGIGALQHWLPVVGKFRFPCRAIVLVYGAVALLAAIAWQRLFDTSSNERPRIAKVAWIVCLASAAVALIASLVWIDFIAGWMIAVMGPLGFAAAALAFTAADRRWRVAPLLLVLITLLDLGVYGLSYAVFDTDQLAHFARDQNMPRNAERPIVAQPIDENMAPAPRGAALQSAGPLAGNRVLLAGFRRADGYAGLVPRRQLDFADPLALRIAGVGFRAVEDPQGYNPAIKWDAVENPLPPVRLAARAIVDEGGPLPATAGELDAALVVEPLELPAGTPGAISDFNERPGHFTLTSEADTRQLLIVSESFHSGWQITVDGQRVPVMPVNRDFLGCLIAPGRHSVTADFHPFSLALGRAGSTLGLGLWCAQWVVAAWWVRRSAKRRTAIGQPASLASVAVAGFSA